MEEGKLAIAVTKGVKGAIQDILAPDIRTIINELNHHTKLLDEHGQKLDNITEGIHKLDNKQVEILTELKFEERFDNIEAIVAGRSRDTVRKVRPY